MTIETIKMLQNQELAMLLFNAVFPVHQPEDRQIESFSIILDIDSVNPIKVIKSGEIMDFVYLLEPEDIAYKDRWNAALMNFAQAIGQALGLETLVMHSNYLEIIIDKTGLFMLKSRSVILGSDQTIAGVHRIADYISNNLVSKIVSHEAQNEQGNTIDD